MKSVVGIARRRPASMFPKTTWIEADVSRDDLRAEPARRRRGRASRVADPALPRRGEDAGDERRRQCARVRSGGAGGRAPRSCTRPPSGHTRRARRTARWTRAGPRTASQAPTTPGTNPRWSASSTTSRRSHPDMRVVRMRPGLIFKREAASEIRRLFAGPLLPGFLVRPALIPIVPDVAAAAVPGGSLVRRRGRVPPRVDQGRPRRLQHRCRACARPA